MLWASVGQTWVEMMLDPTSNIEEKPEQDEPKTHVIQDAVEEEEKSEENNVSFGSMEGVGGAGGCSGREVELEVMVQELEHQVSGLFRERASLQEALTASEEQAVVLGAALMEVKLEKRPDCTEEGGGEEREEESLFPRVEELQEERDKLVRKVQRLEKELAEEKKEVLEARVREETAREQLEDRERECLKLHREVLLRREPSAEGRVQEEAAAAERAKRELVEQEVQRLRQELSMREEEVRSLTAAASYPKSPASSSQRSNNLSSSLIHDMSVDDRAIEEVMAASVKPLLITPSRRGPSASSTPQKESIGEELRGLARSPGVPSPFCEKGGDGEADHLTSCPKLRLLRLQEGLAERMRRLVCDQVGEARTAQAMAGVNQAFAVYRADTQRCVEELHEDTKSGELESKVGEKEVESARSRVTGLVSLLRTANDTLLGGVEASSDWSVDQGSNLSSWQFDLEGIQLLDCTGLGRRILKYSVHDRSGTAQWFLETKEIISLNMTGRKVGSEKELLSFSNKGHPVIGATRPVHSFLLRDGGDIAVT